MDPEDIVVDPYPPRYYTGPDTPDTPITGSEPTRAWRGGERFKFKPLKIKIGNTGYDEDGKYTAGYSTPTPVFGGFEVGVNPSNGSGEVSLRGGVQVPGVADLRVNYTEGVDSRGPFVRGSIESTVKIDLDGIIKVEGGVSFRVFEGHAPKDFDPADLVSTGP
jgi:hypothetical protein